MLSSQQRRTLLVDLHGDQGDILGAAPVDEGIGEWFQADEAPPDALHRMEVSLSEGLSLLPRGSIRSVTRPDRYRLLAAILANEQRQVVVDVGTAGIPSVAVLSEAERAVLVTRACFLGIQAAMRGPRPDEIVLINEPGRALGRCQIADSIKAPVSVLVPWDQSVSRAVDSGELLSRLPRSLRSLNVLL